MNITHLETYLHTQIPLSKVMGIKIKEADVNQVILSAPLALNINHTYTAFGGSVSAAAILSAWLLLHLRVTQENLPVSLVIQKNTINYKKPITDDFLAVCCLDDALAWTTFKKTFQRKGIARIKLSAIVECNQVLAGEFEGWFVGIGSTMAMG